MALYLTAREVAERWGCSQRQVRRLCQRGDLPGMRLGIETWRIPVSAVEAYERRQTSGSGSAPSNEAPKAEASRKEEVRPPVKVDGFSLPAGYEPVFPHLWGRPAPTKKKAASQGH